MVKETDTLISLAGTSPSFITVLSSSSNVAVGLQRTEYLPPTGNAVLVMESVAVVPTFPEVGVKLIPQSPSDQPAACTAAGVMK